MRPDPRRLMDPVFDITFRSRLWIDRSGERSESLIVEITPTRYRTFVSSMMVAPVALGTMFAAMISASLLPVIGWRGVAATGAIPVITSLLFALIGPESVRWFVARP